ncbi:Ig-like domain-containing protein [Wukongibacter baidiensis]|uniref:Ig-like domain-containing protein n=1 Tax=Wukongibacter baidiensis TaxID=1723361 RepID=UPI003D7F8E87
MKKRMLGLLIVFSMIFSFAPLVNSDLEAYADNSGKEIRVRVEGKTTNLHDSFITLTDEETGLDLLKEAVGEASIEGSNGDYGYYITGILGESGESTSEYSSSWGYYVVSNGETEIPMTAIDNLQLDNVDELIFYITASGPNWEQLTFVPKVEVGNEGNDTLIVVNKIVTDWSTGGTSHEPVEGATVYIENVGEYTTDVDGKVVVDLETGEYSVEVFKNGDYPELVRDVFVIIVEDKFNEDDSDYDLWESENTDVASNKTWNIVFNMEIEKDSLQDSIIVVDSERNIVTGEVEVDSNNKTVLVKAPEGGYDAGETYTLYIKNQIQSIDGKTLKASLRMPFTIAE